jgi:hypothetical protein
MGFKYWRHLSLLVLAGAAIAGCNNTPTRPTTLGATNGNPPAGQQANQKPFPINNNAVNTNNPNNNFRPTGGANQPNNTNPFGPASNQDPGRFQPLPNNNPNPFGNPSPNPNPFGNPNPSPAPNPFAPVPNPNGGNPVIPPPNPNPGGPNLGPQPSPFGLPKN